MPHTSYHTKSFVSNQVIGCIVGNFGPDVNKKQRQIFSGRRVPLPGRCRPRVRELCPPYIQLYILIHSEGGWLRLWLNQTAHAPSGPQGPGRRQARFMTFIVHTTSGFPPHYYSQAELTARMREKWSDRYMRRLEQFHDHLRIDGRYLALPLDAYADGHLQGFGASNQAWIDVATDLAQETICRLLQESGVAAGSIAQLTSTTVTGLAVPALDARLMNRIPLRRR